MNFTTILSRSSSSILAHLAKKTIQRDVVLLFSLSANASEVEGITTKLCRSAQQTIGCLSSPHPDAPDSIICSMATFPIQDSIPFRSSIPGRPPVEVGRWSRRQLSPDDHFDFPPFRAKGEEFWGPNVVPPIPSELLGHERSIKSIIFFSDDAPEGLVSSLRATPGTNKLGLVASSTPFINGRPFSLFHNENQYWSGAVGLALLNHSLPTSSVSFPGLVPISEPMKISRAESNLVHELNDSNPSKILMDAIAVETSGKLPSKDEDFFMGHIHFGSASKDRLSRVYRILSGDPQRGSIALDAERAPPENEMVQFFRRDRSSTILEPIQSKTVDSDNRSIRFVCSPQEKLVADPKFGVNEDGIRVFQRTFLAASENGFLCTDAGASKPLWKCNVPGAIGSLEWALTR